MRFDQRVWKLCKRIPKGQVSTYGELARALGTKAYRAVGNALNRNPYSAWGRAGGRPSPSDLVPCHRVVNSDGRVGGFALGTKKKIALLKKEGIIIDEEKIDLDRYMFSF